MTRQHRPERLAPARPGAGAGDTIFALSSGTGRAAIAVVRVSGPAAGDALAQIGGAPPPAPRAAVLRRFRKPCSGEPIDRGLALWFPAPESATGEDVAEFHIHGGPAVVAALANALAALPGLRPAEPGEFTRRAFTAGRLDLTEAEGIADLIAAETEAQRRQALRQMEGGLHTLYESWRGSLLEAMAHVEATLDFSDQDLPDDATAVVGSCLAALETEIAAHLDDDRRGERLRAGFSVAILGAPNAGKSSLLNRLTGRDAAIVSARAGTTRDVIEVHLDIAGWPVTIADTAGLRESTDEVEGEGVRRALAQAERADLALVVLDGARWPAADRQSLTLACEASLLVLNKIDLLPGAPPATVEGRVALPISCRTGAGIDTLVSSLAAAIERCYPIAAEPVLTRPRHRQALADCRAALTRARVQPADERLAEELRLAATALGRITGRVDVEDVLDIVFRDFCIGK